ncbi:DUF6182 family protein [Streptomyces sp.]|uniref:DUF6182 family protein n=1 Tax=Streptomyces sp. TaxID=1931 RepID=UPI002F3E6B2E
MTAAQQRLLADVAARVRRARPDLAAHFPLDTAEDLDRIKEAVLAEPDATAAVCVLGRIDLAAWTAGTCAFALALPAEAASRWRRSFTRTVYLAGSPARLADRFAFAHTAGDCAWALPAPPEAYLGLRRLLKALDAPGPLPAAAPVTVEVPAVTERTRRTPVHRELYVATAGVPVSGVLVHLGHLLAEAVFDELVLGTDTLTLRQLPQLPVGSFAALRVDADSTAERGRGRLRLWAALTAPLPSPPSGAGHRCAVPSQPREERNANPC